MSSVFAICRKTSDGVFIEVASQGLISLTKYPRDQLTNRQLSSIIASPTDSAIRSSLRFDSCDSLLQTLTTQECCEGMVVVRCDGGSLLQSRLQIENIHMTPRGHHNEEVIPHVIATFHDVAKISSVNATGTNPLMKDLSKRNSIIASTASFSRNPSIRLDFDIQTYQVGGGESGGKTVLKDVTGQAVPGDLLALMGPSGSGKTTLLNILAGRVSRGLEGEILFNNARPKRKQRRQVAYVLQDDTFFGMLTVRETLHFSALLRLPNTITRASKIARAEEVMELLGLQKCAQTIIGTPFARGVSGGERKRVNIGCELMSDPSLIMLDEPTSGLDASTALQIIEILRELTKQNKTIITSIHQPSSHIFQQFDKLLLLGAGRVIFSGKARDAAEYFAAGGYPCPLHFNIADFMIELSSDGSPSQGPLIEHFATHHLPNARSTMSKQMIISNNDSSKILHMKDKTGTENGARNEPEDGDDLDIEAGIPNRNRVPALEHKSNTISKLLGGGNEWPTTWWQQFVVLSRRSLTQKRGASITGLQTTQCLLIALICTVLWWNLPKTEAAIRERTGVIFFSTVFWSFSPLFTALMSFPSERAVVAKERAAGTYRLSAYFMAKTVAELPPDVLYPTLYWVIVYWTVNLQRTPYCFFCTLLTLLLSSQVAVSVGLLIGTLTMNIPRAQVMASVTMLGSMLVGGFYVRSDQMYPWIRWIRYFSYTKYGYELMLQVEASGMEFKCASTTLYTSCPITDREYLDTAQVEFSQATCTLVLLLFVFALRLTSYLILLFRFKPGRNA